MSQSVFSSHCIPTRAERELKRKLQTRPQRTDDQFYSAYYKDCGLPLSTISTLRCILSEQVGVDLSGLHTDDDLSVLGPEIDWMIVLAEVEKEFEVRFTDSEIEHGVATFDFFVQNIRRKQVENLG